MFHLRKAIQAGQVSKKLFSHHPNRWQCSINKSRLPPPSRAAGRSRGAWRGISASLGGHPGCCLGLLAAQRSLGFINKRGAPRCQRPSLRRYSKSHHTLQAASNADLLYLNQLLVQKSSAPLHLRRFFLLSLVLRDKQQALPKKQSPLGSVS